MRARFPSLVSKLLLTLIATTPAPGVAAMVHYGAKLGVNLANIHGDFSELANPKMQPGFQGGGFVSFSFVPAFALELDALYVEKGFKTVSEGTDASGNPTGTADNHLRLHYLDVPVLARVSLPQWGAVTPYMLGGPNIGISLGGRVEGIDQSADVSSDLQKVDMGLTGGVGLKWPARSFEVGLESRYTSSFSDLWNFSNNLESINHGVSIVTFVAR